MRARLAYGAPKLLLHRNANLKWRATIDVERGKSLTQTTRASKEVNNGESERQVCLLNIGLEWCILGWRNEARGQMTDIVDKATRSRMMAGIRGKDTKPELALRRGLHARGFRYRLHAKKIAGRPDLVLPKYHAVIFVHGCYWHRHKGCRYATTPSTRPEFWQTKFEANVRRDRKVQTQLLETGWRVATVWECALRKPDQERIASGLVTAWLRGGPDTLELGEREIMSSAESTPGGTTSAERDTKESVQE